MAPLPVAVRQNVRVRKLLIAVGAAVFAVVVGAVGADFGAAIYAEYRLARTVRTAAGLSFDPSVAILGFPFIRQAMNHHYDEVEIKANGVEPPRGRQGRAWRPPCTRST